MILSKMEKHIKLCQRNLKSNRVKCCANCPFEEEITAIWPELAKLFVEKRKKLTDGERNHSKD